MGEGEGTRGSELHNILECKIFVFTRMVVVVMAVLAVSAGLESRKGEGWRERERERERGVRERGSTWRKRTPSLPHTGCHRDRDRERHTHT